VDAALRVKRDDVEMTATRGTAQLQKVYQKEGHLFGVIETRADFILKTMHVPGQTLTLSPGSKITVKSVYDGCIDGTSTECSEYGSYLFNGIIRATGADGFETKMDQEIDLTLHYSAK
jgi:hypothetical protein